MTDAHVTRQSRNTVADKTPLFVDLDGTLIKTDLLLESFLELLRTNPFALLRVPLWLLKGKAYLKYQIAIRTDIDPFWLPYNTDFRAFLEGERLSGRALSVASASNRKLVELIADHIGLFDQVLASSERLNLSGTRKLEAIRVAASGDSFDYAGNDHADIPIFAAARQAILVNAPASVARAACQTAQIYRVFKKQRVSLRTYLEAVRIHQWLKNLLLFVPLLMAHEFTDIGRLLQLLLAFLAFSLAASATYVFNDLIDLPHDRKHPRKRFRPITSGEISILRVALIIPSLMFIAALITWQLPPKFGLSLACYIAVTLTYSMRLKRIIALDVIALSGLYTLRLIAGGAAVYVPISFWLLAFSMFLFLSLALVKRYCEISSVLMNETTSIGGRGYRVEDLQILAQLGTSSGLLAVLVLALYINSEQVLLLYSLPQAIWLLCPAMLYWISRIWILAARGEIDDDPVMFAARDRRTHIIALIMLIILWIAR